MVSNAQFLRSLFHNLQSQQVTTDGIKYFKPSEIALLTCHKCHNPSVLKTSETDKNEGMEELVVVPALCQLSNSHQDIKEPLPMSVEIQADLVAIVSIHLFLFNFTSLLLN